MAAGDVKIIQAEHKPRKALVCDGADDWAEINAFTVAQVLANDTKGTFTAWIKVSDLGGPYCIISSGDDSVVEHLHLAVEDGEIIAQCKVNTVMQWDIITDEDLVTPDKWHHVALVHDGTRPYLYLDGVLMTVTDTVSTDLTAWYDDLTGGDHGAIGVLDMNSTETLDFDGGISDVKYWDTDLTIEDIQADFHGNTPATDELISHWVMEEDEAIDDISSYDGTLAGNAYTDPYYSDLTNKAHQAWVAAGDNWALTSQEGMLTVLHVEGV